MSNALIGDGVANLEVVTHIGETGRESMSHYRRASSHRTLCGHTCDDDGAFGEWILERDAHPEDACGLSGDVCQTCDASYRKARRVAAGGDARVPDGRAAWKRENAYPRVRPVDVGQIRGDMRRSKAPETAPVLDPSSNLIRLYRAELEALGTPAASAELERRAAKRATKRAKRKGAAR